MTLKFEQLMTIFDLLDEGIVIIEKDGYISSVNENAYSLLNMEKNCLIGRSFVDLPTNILDCLGFSKIEVKGFVEFLMSHYPLKKRFP